jgi:hypothetical protein
LQKAESRSEPASSPAPQTALSKMMEEKVVAPSAEIIEEVQAENKVEAIREGEPEQEKPITLVIQSLYSGKREEIVVPVNLPEQAVVEQADKEPQQEAELAIQRGEEDPGVTDKAEETILYQTAAITVSRNSEKKGIEVKFAVKPEERWRAELKSQKFRFTRHGGGVWWRKESTASIPAIIHFAKEYSAAAEKEDTAVNSQTEKTVAAENRISSANADIISSKVKDFQRYLALADRYPEALIIMAHPAEDSFIAYGKDAQTIVEVSNLSISRIKLPNEEHNTIEAVQIPQSKIEKAVQQLQNIKPVVLFRNLKEIETHFIGVALPEYENIEYTETFRQKEPMAGIPKKYRHAFLLGSQESSEIIIELTAPAYPRIMEQMEGRRLLKSGK